jgi:hypothetical protein
MFAGVCPRIVAITGARQAYSFQNVARGGREKQRRQSVLTM